MLAYLGHHKCGSTWIWEVVRTVAREIGLRHYLVFDELTPQAKSPLLGYAAGRNGPSRTRVRYERADLRRQAEQAKAEIVSCMTADRAQLDVLAPRKAFHVIRDPRDIIVSGYFSHRNSRPTDHPGAHAWGMTHIAEHRERVLAVPKEQGLILEMDFAKTELFELADWDYSRPEVLELRLEELAARPYEGFISIFRHLGLLVDEEPTKGRQLAAMWLRRTRNRLAWRRGLGALRRQMPLSGEILLGAVYANRFEAKSKGRRPGTEDTASHYRKGVAGDWANHFTELHVEAFNERFGDLLQRLGYEADENWGADERRPLAQSPAGSF